MQAERDAIHMTVVPELRTMAQKYGEDVEVCDLRWGVNTGDLDSEAGRKNYRLSELEKSVTALEIEYGALDDPEVLKRSIFMFREPMPEADGD